MASEYTDLLELGIEDIDELTEQFSKAAKHLQSLASELGNETLLLLYSYYKQGLEGPCNVPKPSWYDLKNKSKWEAWKNLGNMSNDDAKQQYINLVEKLDPAFKSTVASKIKEGWVTVSTLQHNIEEELVDTEKSITDYVREGDLEKVKEYLSVNSNVNELDENGLGLIHWAADRGFLEMLMLLISYNADVNLRDKDGQTALHYAACCGYIDCVKFLLKNGADTAVLDSDGFNPMAVASDDPIREYLAKYIKL